MYVIPPAFAPLRHAAGQVPSDAWIPLHNEGLQAVLNLRPAAEQPGVDEAALVRAAGMAYFALPIAGPQDMDRECVQAFDRILRQNAGTPLLIHCASSNRVGALVALHAAWIQGLPVEAALALGRTAGLAGLAGTVETLLNDAGG